MKQAFQVYFSVCTRIIADIPASKSLEEMPSEILNKIIEEAREKIIKEANLYLRHDTLEKLMLDEECKYGTFVNEPILFSIDGFWKDDKEEFSNYIVSGKELEEGLPEGWNDDDIFFYGLSESAIQEAISKGIDFEEDFVITSYSREL